MKQHTLFNVPAPKPPRKRKSAAVRRAERDRAFERFHEENKHVYELLRDMALRLKRAGHEHWGMRCLYETLRYKLAVKTNRTAPVLNDWFAPYYSRKLMAEVAELEGFFEVRERRKA